MYKNLKTPAVERFDNGNCHVYIKLFPAKQHFFKWIPAPENCKNQRKLTELKLCTLATNNLILS